MNVGPVPGGPATDRPAGFRQHAAVPPDINGGPLYAEPFGDLGDAYGVAISHERTVAKVLTVDQDCSDNQYMTQIKGMSQEQYNYLVAHLNAEAQRLSSPQVQVTIIKAKRSAVTGEPIILIGRSK